MATIDSVIVIAVTIISAELISNVKLTRELQQYKIMC